MLSTFTEEYVHFLVIVAIFLLIPTDTSECERIFSIMNDIKSAERNSLGTEVLKDLMIWYYYGKEIPS